nr:MAG TPA: helix-turn-helix domain protein [Inoviridae sp.]
MIYIDKILNELKKNNLKMIDLANALGINKSVISAWKRRQTNPPLEYLVDICKLIKVSPNELLEYEDTNNDELSKIYNMLDETDKQVIDLILTKYKKENAKLLDSKIS